MLYKKPPNMRYTQMCMFIDNNIRSEDKRVKETCFEYLWHIFYILAVKQKMFKNARDYDEYALYGATQVYLRYQKENQPGKFETLKPIKSCLNYIKKVLYPMKINYQQATFGQVLGEEALGEAPAIIQDDRVEMVRKSISTNLTVEYEQYLREISKTLKMVLSTSPYSNDPVMMHNIYLSCLLTLLKLITPSNKNLARLQKKIDRALPVDNLEEQIYAEESKESPVTYHLDSSMANYISTLVNRMKKEIAKDLRFIIGSYEPPESVIKDVLNSPLEEYLDVDDNY